MQPLLSRPAWCMHLQASLIFHRSCALACVARQFRGVDRRKIPPCSWYALTAGSVRSLLHDGTKLCGIAATTIGLNGPLASTYWTRLYSTPLDSNAKLNADALCRWSKYQFHAATQRADAVRYSSLLDAHCLLVKQRSPRASLKGTSPTIRCQMQWQLILRPNYSWLRGVSSRADWLTKLAFDDDFMEAECVDDGLRPAVQLHTTPSPPHLQSMTLTSDMCKKVLLAAFVVTDTFEPTALKTLLHTEVAILTTIWISYFFFLSLIYRCPSCEIFRSKLTDVQFTMSSCIDLQRRRWSIQQ